MPKTFPKFFSAILLLATISLLLFEAHLLTRAADPAEAPAEEESSQPAEIPNPFVQNKDSKCVSEINKYMLNEQIRFGIFINKHFQSELPTSELVPTAVEKFREFRNKSRAQVGLILKDLLKEKGANLTALSQEEEPCKKAVEDNIGIMQNLLKQHIVANAYAKKSTRLLDKYKQINGKLSKLNFTIAQMYGYFSALSQRIPCYPSECVNG